MNTLSESLRPELDMLKAQTSVITTKAEAFEDAKNTRIAELEAQVEALKAGGVERLRSPAASDAFAARYQADADDPACSEELAIYCAGWADADRAARAQAPALKRNAQAKLDALIASGFEINGVAIHRTNEGGQPERGFVTSDGFVGWWLGATKGPITLDFKQATELLEMFGGEPCEITLRVCTGHSGEGLYASYTDLPEEGAEFLGASDNEAVPVRPQAPAAVEPEPAHWLAVLDPEQVPQQPKERMHAVGFRDKRTAETWIAGELDFNGWRYNLKPLYDHPAVPTTKAEQPTKETTAAMDEHAAFESWAESHYPDIDLEREGEGYRHSLAQEWWDAWQARAALAATPAAPADALSQAARDVLAERQRQISVEGWTPERDDRYPTGDLASAAACYAMQGRFHYPVPGKPGPNWPWAPEWWKPSTYRRNLEKSGALIIAEIERFDRAAIAAQTAQQGGTKP